MILPFLVLCFMFSYFPLHGWIYALYDYKPPKKLSSCEFVGLKWFQMLFSNPTQIKQLMVVMQNTFALSLLGIATSIFPLLFAVFLNENDTTYVEPDISVICDKNKLNEHGCNGAPDFIIEIVSPSSRKMD